jgi:hypothetical protein
MTAAQLQSDAPLTAEFTSITALVEYLEFNGSSRNAYGRLAAQFEVTDVKQIKRRDYDRAVRYLVDFQEQRAN